MLIPYHRAHPRAPPSSLRCPQVHAIPPRDVKTKTNLRRIAFYHDLSLLIVSPIAYMHQNSPILLVSLVLIIFWIDYCICRILRVWDMQISSILVWICGWRDVLRRRIFILCSERKVEEKNGEDEWGWLGSVRAIEGWRQDGWLTAWQDGMGNALLEK